MYTALKKISLTKDVAFLNKSDGKWSKVDKPVTVPTSYEGDDYENNMFFTNNNSNYHSNVASDSESDEETKENLFDKHVDAETKVTPKTMLNTKVICAEYLNYFCYVCCKWQQNFKENIFAELHEKHSKKTVGEKLKDISRFGNIWSYMEEC